MLKKIYRKYLEDQARLIYRDLPWWEKEQTEEEFAETARHATNEQLIEFIKEWSK